MNTFELNHHIEKLAETGLARSTKELLSRFATNEYLKNPLGELQRLTRMLETAKTAHTLKPNNTVKSFATPNSPIVLARWKLLLYHHRKQCQKHDREFPCEQVTDEYKHMLRLGHTDALDPSKISQAETAAEKPTEMPALETIDLRNPPSETTAMAAAFKALIRNK